MTTSLTLDQFQENTACLKGLPVTRVQEGYYHTLILHLGSLTERKFHDGTTILEGEASIMFEWDWRVERSRSIWFGSRSSPRKRTNGQRAILNRHIETVQVEGRLPELSVRLVGGVWVRSLAALEGQPRWTVFPPDGSHIAVQVGKIYLTTPESKC